MRDRVSHTDRGTSSHNSFISRVCVKQVDRTATGFCCSFFLFCFIFSREISACERLPQIQIRVDEVPKCTRLGIKHVNAD